MRHNGFERAMADGTLKLIKSKFSIYHLFLLLRLRVNKFFGVSKTDVNIFFLLKLLREK